MSSKPTPLPLGDTLRDLALLRAADLDLSAVLPPAVVSPAAADKRSGEDQIVQQSVERSYAFANEARAVIRLLNRGDVDKEGARLEEVRAKLEDVLQALDEHKDTPA
ncbi:hypothetical protein CERSUDRAFT_114459 [Gelatoporia subvermispora B]|uniref:Uncharacterized protein n=1 Tax=Ceriporiopsis subvermispora (strain B) TaxID=914234 RepID=M2QZW9_CERS8|nr:hypothetical protein CERSUDRAFT_114459 [Gelatoporia subvermispora B]